MNEKLQYATMLEIPVNTCSVTFQPAKKKRVRTKKNQNPDAVKEKLLSKINAEKEDGASLSVANETATEQNAVEQEFFQQPLERAEQPLSDSGVKNKKWNIKSLRFSVIGVQLVVIGILVATIFLTNAFYADSGINVFMRQVFGNQTTVEQVDLREYKEFAPVIALDGDMATSVSNGVIGFTGAGSVYAPCDGVVSAVFKGEDGKYTLEIAHSQNFKTTLSGLDYAYAELDDKVFSNIPVGYFSNGEASMCFTLSDGTVISDYELVDNSVVWAA